MAGKDISKWETYKLWSARFEGLRPCFTSDIDTLRALYLMWEDKNSRRGYGYRWLAYAQLNALVQLASDIIGMNGGEINEKIFKPMDEMQAKRVNKYYWEKYTAQQKRESRRTGEDYVEVKPW